MNVSPEVEAVILASATTVAGVRTEVLIPPEPPKPRAKRKRSTPQVVTDLPTAFAVTLALPCRVVSEMNTRGHWAARHGRFKAQADVLLYAVRELGWYSILTDRFRWPFALPAVVTLTHVGREIDDDNLRGAFKGLRDFIAQWAGIDDKDKRIQWVYEQRAGEPGVEVTIRGKA